MKARSNDPMIRAALVRRLIDAGIPRNCIRHEITLDSSSSDGRADLVVIRDAALVGVEIKSGRDTLERLVSQRPRYSARFDRVLLVCDERHKPWKDDLWGWEGWEAVTATFDGSAIKFVENYWSGMGALLNPPPKWCDSSGSYLAPRAMLQMLWANEIKAISGCGTRTSGIPHIAENVPLKGVRAAVINALRSRQLNRWEEKFWQAFDAEQREAA
jgi:hypothetical protein